MSNSKKSLAGDSTISKPSFSKETAHRNITMSPAKAAPSPVEEHWNDQVLKEVSKEQIGFIAEGLFKELWARCGKNVAGEQVSLMIAEVQFSRGFDLLYKVHDNDAALTEFRKCLAIRESILGKDHRDTGKTYCFVGHALREKRDYDDSITQYRRALRVLVTLLGKDHNHTKDVISCIDDVLKAKGLNDNQSAEYLTTLLKSLENKNNADNALQEGNTSVAIGLYRKALVVEDLPDGRNHPDTADIYSCIANSLAKQGELQKASVEYGNALGIYASTLGGDHPDTMEALDNITNVRVRLEDGGILVVLRRRTRHSTSLALCTNPRNRWVVLRSSPRQWVHFNQILTAIST